VAHPGHVRGEDDRGQALKRVARSVLQAWSNSENTDITLLLETTSGQKGELGATFEELAEMISDIENSGSNPLKVGVCLDTAHIWAAGYDLSGPKGQETVLDNFDRIIGLDRLRLIHLNDSKFGLGERKDRHAPVGKGFIGARAMARLVRHPRLSHLAGIMETPRQSEADDVENMARAKRWRRRRTA
jgi:deoxyribonuclease-4